MFFTNQDMNNLLTKKYKNAIKYVEYGESVPIILKKGATKGRMIKGVVNLASFKQKYEKGKHPWYCLKPKKEEKKLQKKIIIQKIYDDTYKIALIEKPILVNNTFYELVLKPEFQGQETIIISLLFFALTVLSLELHGRTNFGGGALDTSVTDIENIMILNPKNLSKEMLQEIQQKATPLFHQKFAPFEKMIKSPERFVFDQYLVNILGLKISVDELYQKLQSIIIKRKRKRKEEKSA